MKKIVSLTAAAILALSATGAYAQENTGDTSKKEIKHLIGMNASSISGMGISYGYKFHPDFMLKVNGIYIENQDKSTDFAGNEYYITDIYWNAGVEIQRDIFRITLKNRDLTGYGLLGGSYWYEKFDDPEYPSDNGLSRSWTAGIALGVRMIFFDHISLNVEFGYQYGRDFIDSERYTGVAGGIGAHFAF